MAKECIQYITRGTIGSSDAGQEILIDETRKIDFESPNKSVDGFVVFHGWSITHAKITIKLRKFNKGQPFTTEISTTPWKLTQIQNAHNYLVSARDDLDSINYTGLDMQQAGKIIDRVAGKIKQAQEQLLTPDAAMFHNYHSQMAFLPKLPTNLNIEFSIAHRNLEINIYLVQTMASPSKHKAPAAPPVSGAHEAIIDTYNQQIYEVIEQISVQRPNRRLENIFRIILTIYDLCSELREKLVALSSISPTFL